ncbi:hypothetical protein BC941DRAFT_445901 [Chlamydoabsidia padenii]|nr:hypothetical protein BC941DRAFT_445901 [Chlamydoabsidia padenii]
MIIPVTPSPLQSILTTCSDHGGQIGIHIFLRVALSRTAAWFGLLASMSTYSSFVCSSASTSLSISSWFLVNASCNLKFSSCILVPSSRPCLILLLLAWYLSSDLRKLASLSTTGTCSLSSVSSSTTMISSSVITLVLVYCDGGGVGGFFVLAILILLAPFPLHCQDWHIL